MRLAVFVGLALGPVVGLGCSVADDQHAPRLGTVQQALGTCGNSVQSANVNGTLEITLNDFFDLSRATAMAPYDVASLLADVPSSLKVATASLSEGDRARQLAAVVHIANAVTRTDRGTVRVRVVVPGDCDYDFSTVTGWHVDTYSGVPWDHRSLQPKLFIAANNRSIVGDNQYPHPTLKYAGAGSPDGNHGRVIVMVPNYLSGVTLERLRIVGDHDWSQREEPAYYLHENHSALSAEGDIWSRAAPVMVGAATGSPPFNGVTLDKLVIEAFPMNGVSLTGGGVVTNSTIVGVLPSDATGMRTTLEGIPGHIGVAGFGYQTGILATYGGNAIIAGNRIERAMEGVNASLDASWTVTGNSFASIGDHGFYALGLLSHSHIDNNTFSLVLNSAIKIGGGACPGSTCDPLTPSERRGAFASTVSGNTFNLVGREVIQLSGTFNTISNNLVYAYGTHPLESPPPGNEYDPSADPENVHPDFWFGTDAGQGTYANHVAFNSVRGNSKIGSAAPLTMLFTQHHGAPGDRSIALNAVEGSGQAVYFNSRTDSMYAPAITVTGGATLHAGVPTECSDCTGNPDDYRRAPTDLDVTWHEPFRRVVGTTPVAHVLVRYGTRNDVFVLGDNGVHRRLTSAATTFRAVADLDGDGQDELYYSAAGASAVRGTRIYANYATREVADPTIESWSYYSGPAAPVAFAPVRGRSNQNQILALAYAGTNAIHGTVLSGGNPVIGPSIASTSSAVVKLQAADLSTAGESGSITGEELYAVLASGNIAGIYHDGTSWSAPANVYSGSVPLSIMVPARVRRQDGTCAVEPKQRMYQRFVGPTVYETLVPSPGALPGFATGQVFYGGTEYTDILVAADLDSDGHQELLSHYAGIPGKIYYGNHTCGNASCTGNAGYSYDGSAVASMIRRVVTSDGRERVLTIFSGYHSLYLSEGLNDNGYDYAEWVRAKRWLGEGLTP